MRVDGGGGVGVVGQVPVITVDGADDGVDPATAGDAWDGRTLVDGDGGGGGEPPRELLREVVGLVSSVSRSA